MPAKKAVNEQDVLKHLAPFAEGLKKSVGQLWKMFVMRYVAKGIAEVFVAGVTMWIATDKLWTNHWGYWCIPFVISMVLMLDAIQLLINPYYPAMNDVVERLKKESNGSGISIINNR